MPRHVLPPVERKRKHPSHYYKNRGTPREDVGGYALAFVLVALFCFVLSILVAINTL